ncbi:hypothetical protein IT414_02665 [bacterium]|nr:hypothetical protein [bacterium]
MLKPQNKIEELQHSSAKLGVDELIEVLNSPKRLAWLNFYTGFLKGAGGVLGAAVVLVLLGLAVRYLGGVPWIGELIRQIGQAAKIK